MPIPIMKYNQIKNNYCVSYYGLNKEYLIQLKLLRPIIEKTYKDMSLYISCNDNCFYLLKNEKNVFKRSEAAWDFFSYNRIIEDSINFHPVERFLKESLINCGPIELEEKKVDTKKCAFLINGNFPTRKLTGRQISLTEKKFIERGFKVEINPKLEEIISSFEIVVGVENEILYEAASKGVETYLIPTGIGENLFISMFPKNKIFNPLN